MVQRIPKNECGMWLRLTSANQKISRISTTSFVQETIHLIHSCNACLWCPCCLGVIAFMWLSLIHSGCFRVGSFAFYDLFGVDQFQEQISFERRQWLCPLSFLGRLGLVVYVLDALFLRWRTQNFNMHFKIAKYNWLANHCLSNEIGKSKNEQRVEHYSEKAKISYSREYAFRFIC